MYQGQEITQMKTLRRLFIYGSSLFYVPIVQYRHYDEPILSTYDLFALLKMPTRFSQTTGGAWAASIGFQMPLAL